MRCTFLMVFVCTVTFVVAGSAWSGDEGEVVLPADLVDITTAAPSIVVDMRYAGEKNFTGRTIYTCNRCFLKRTTATKLAAAAAELATRGLRLKVWDCYRPLAVQKLFWSLVPDTRYVADPRKGSRHNRGTAVDVTLVDAEGNELPMPTGFDDFSRRASHDYSDLPSNAIRNRAMLASTMRKAGFVPIATEWWHYDDSSWSGAAVLDMPFDGLCVRKP